MKLLDGCVFSTAGNLSRSSIDITKAIKDNGGTVSYLITKKTTHLLTTAAEVQSKSTKVRSAFSYGAHILREDFLWDAISGNSIPPTNAYLIPVDLEQSTSLSHTDKHALSTHTHTYAPTPSSAVVHVPTPTISITPTLSGLSTLTLQPSVMSFIKPTQQSDLNPQVKDLVERIYSEATSEFVTNFDAKITPKGIETPLGVLSSFQIDKGERVLKEINQILKASEEEVCSNPKLEVLSSQFYTTIPHNIGKSLQEAQARVIRTLPHLQAKQEHLQLMRDILAASSTGALNKSEIDVKYKALKCDIQPLNKGTPEYSEVQNQVNQNNNSFEVVSIYKIKRANEHERFTKSMANQKTLFHGTHIANVVGVLSRGILPPKTLIGVGGKRTDFGWLGSGIYFSPNAENSSKFTTPGKSGTRFLLVATVALGTIKEYTQITPSLERPPMGFHSAHGKAGSGSEFTADEYAVYKPEQQKLEYLVEFRLRNEAPSSNALVLGKSPKKSPATKKSSTFSSSVPYSAPVSSATPKLAVNLNATDSAIKSKEDNYRNLFVQSRNHPDLKNPHLMLVDISNTSKFMYNNDDAEYPLILQSHREARSGCAVVSSSQFTENFNKFTENQFKGMNWDNVFVAGGCVLASMLRPDAQGNGYKSSDVDMFFYGLNESQANQKLKYIYELVKENTQSPCEVIRTKHAVTIVNQFPFRHIQIVLRLYKSPAEVLMGFDIDSCAVGYDGKNAYALERACRAITRGYNLVDMSRRSLTYESRLYKYSKRGFAVAIPGFDRNKVNPEIFAKSLKDVKGLAQLLLFEFNAFKTSTTRNPFKSNKVPTSQIKHPDAFTQDRLQEFETLRANKELPDSDYSSVYIPWGPQWFAKQILNLLNYQDKAQFFAKKNNIKHKHIFVSGIQGVLDGKSFWCRKCKDHVSTSTPIDENGEDYVTGPLKWLQDNPGRQLLTGSFHPVSDDEWETQAYRTGDDATFPLLSGIFSKDSSQISANAKSPSTLSSSRIHPLLFASLLGNVEAVETLLRNGVSLSSVRDANNLNAAHYAAVGGSVEVLRALVKSDSRILGTSGNSSGITPLHLSLYYGNLEAAQFVLERAGESEDSNGRSPIHFAALGGSVQCCKLFLKSNQDAHLISKMASDGLTPITAAKKNGHQELLRYFLTVTPSNIDASTTYSELITSPPNAPHLQVLNSVASGEQVNNMSGDINEHDAFGIRPLHVAATLPRSSYPSVLKSLIQSSDLDAKCADVIGQNPAHYAVLFGNSDALFDLQNELQDFNKPNMLGQTPQYYAAILLGTLSGFRNNDVLPGLPEPRYRQNLQKIANFFGSGTTVLSPYPLPPLLPSEFLSFPSPFEQQIKPIPTVAPLPTAPSSFSSFGFSSNAPTGVAGKFQSFGTSTFGSVTAAKSPKKASAYKSDEYEPEEEEDEEETKLPSFGFGSSKPAKSVGKGVKPSTGLTNAGFGSTGFGASTSGFGASTGFGSNTSGFGSNTSGFGASTSGFGASTSGFSSNASGFGQPAQKPLSSFFKPSPAKSLFGGEPDEEEYAVPQQQSNVPLFGTPQKPASGFFGSQPVQQSNAAFFGTAPQPAVSSSSQEPPSILARVLVLISLLNKGRSITLDEKGLLKDAALAGHPLLVAAVECYEIDQDLDEFSDTISRVISLLRR